MHKILILMALGASLGCTKTSGGSQSNTVPVEGVNLTGTYSFQDIVCFSSDYTSVTASGVITGAYTEEIKIQGNAFTRTVKSGCQSVAKGSAVFGPDTVKLTIDFVASSSAAGNYCNITKNIDNPVITPNGATTNYTSGTSLATVTTAPYVSNDTSLALLSNYSDGNNGACYLVYVKE